MRCVGTIDVNADDANDAAYIIQGRLSDDLVLTNVSWGAENATTICRTGRTPIKVGQ